MKVKQKESPKEDAADDTPKKPAVSTESSKIGDESNVALWGMLAGVATLTGLGLVAFSFRKKKHKKEK